MTRIEEIEGRLSAATRSPDEEWHWNGNEIVCLSEPRRGIAGVPDNEPDETAVFIAAAPTNLRYLLDFAKAATPVLGSIVDVGCACRGQGGCVTCKEACAALALLEVPDADR